MRCAHSTSLQVQGGGSLLTLFSDTNLSRPSKETPNAARCSGVAGGSRVWTSSKEMSGISERRPTKAKWTASARDFLVSLIRLRAATWVPPTIETSGPRSKESFASCDLNTHSWKTSQLCLITGTSAKFSGAWPRSGTMSNGIAYLRAPSAPLKSVIDYGFWRQKGWSTPLASDKKRAKMRLEALARGYAKHLRSGKISTSATILEVAAEEFGALPSPLLMEWIMGLPPKWTDLRRSGMRNARCKPPMHGSALEGR